MIEHSKEPSPANETFYIGLYTLLIMGSYENEACDWCRVAIYYEPRTMVKAGCICHLRKLT